jgi:murein DD-endopeptidase MepM/ murein hydrolase activator NlpD
MQCFSQPAHAAHFRYAQVMAVFGLLAALCLPTPPALAQQPAVELHANTPAYLARIAGVHRLVYELHVTNDSDAPVELVALDVLADDDMRILHLDRRALAADANLQDDSTALAPHAQAVVYLTVGTGREVPASVHHRLTLRQDGRESELRSPNVPVPTATGPVLGPPVRGGSWVAVYSDKWPRGHRRVFIETNGHARLPGRFAIDWMKVDDQGRTLKNDSGLAASSYSYGAKVLAAADAYVAAVRDGVTEARLIADNQSHPHPDAAGNYVSLDLGSGRFATYEHLRPGSIEVAKGERVRKGQVIAEVGFSGDSTEPHLHFHVSDSAMPLEGEGLPYVMDRFRVTGRITDWQVFGSQRWTDLPPRIVEREFPESGDVVDFTTR